MCVFDVMTSAYISNTKVFTNVLGNVILCILQSLVQIKCGCVCNEQSLQGM